jgi:hypothetical protein
MPRLRFPRLDTPRPLCALFLVLCHPLSSILYPQPPSLLPAQFLPVLAIIRDTVWVGLGHGWGPLGIHFGSTWDPLRTRLN